MLLPRTAGAFFSAHFFGRTSRRISVQCRHEHLHHAPRADRLEHRLEASGAHRHRIERNGNRAGAEDGRGAAESGDIVRHRVFKPAQARAGDGGDYERLPARRDKDGRAHNRIVVRERGGNDARGQKTQEGAFMVR